MEMARPYLSFSNAVDSLLGTFLRCVSLVFKTLLSAKRKALVSFIMFAAVCSYWQHYLRHYPDFL